MDRTPGQKISKEITDLNIIDQRGASLVAQLVKNPPTIQETSCNAGDPGSSLGQEDPLEKKMTTHSSILIHEKSHGQRGLADYSLWGHKRVDTT